VQHSQPKILVAIALFAEIEVDLLIDPALKAEDFNDEA
jgi:hypothetical protein